MKRSDWVKISIAILLYIGLLFSSHREIFTYQFNPDLVQRYLRSQDIPHEVAGRVFLSDSDIHIAAGYLYAKGHNPTEFNFQHSPLIKYLFGTSLLLFGNPFYVQIIFGICLLIGTYFLTLKIFHSSTAAFLAVLIFANDPLFLSVSSNALLDLGQSVFFLAYFIAVIFYPKKWVWQGILLGLLAGSKFWAAAVFFVGILTLYQLYKREFYLKNFVKHIFLAFLIFAAIYTKAFIDHKGLFNIIFFELKTFKYWLHHSIASMFGSSLFLFLTGNIKSWWGNRGMVRSETWTILWPVSLITSIYLWITQLQKKKINEIFLVGMVPLAYLLYLGAQAPFPRYFILILPFCYACLAHLAVRLVTKQKSH